MKPLHRDLVAYAHALQGTASLGYAIADATRGFAMLDADTDANDVLFIALAWAGLAAAVCFYIALPSSPRTFPHFTAEALNVLAAALYCVTTATYFQEGDKGDGTLGASSVASAVVCIELAAALITLFDAGVYVAAWVEDATDESSGGSEAYAALEGDATATRHRRGTCAHLCTLFQSQAFSLELQSQIWNAIPALIYAVSASVATTLHFTQLAFDAFHDSRSARAQKRVSQLAALRLASRGYVVGDVLFFADAALAAAAWLSARHRTQMDEARAVARREEESGIIQ